MYKIDNRPRKHKGRYTFLGIILGVGLCFAFLYLYNNYLPQTVSQPIKGKIISKIQTNIETQISKINQQVQTNPDMASQNPIVTSPTQTITSLPNPIDLDSLEQGIHAQINNIRTSNGLSELVYDEQIAKVARNHSQDMLTNGYFDHTSLDGKTVQNRLSTIPCFTDGENIEENYAPINAANIVSVWMGDSGHSANILSNAFTKEGIGVAQSNGDLMITEDFC